MREQSPDSVAFVQLLQKERHTYTALYLSLFQTGQHDSKKLTKMIDVILYLVLKTKILLKKLHTYYAQVDAQNQKQQRLKLSALMHRNFNSWMESAGVINLLQQLTRIVIQKLSLEAHQKT